MKHKTHHHKAFITLLLLLVMAVGFILGQGMPVNGAFQMITFLVNTTFLVIITHFMLEIYSGNRVLEVVDVTPKPKTEEKTSTPKKSSKKTAKKTKKKAKK